MSGALTNVLASEIKNSKVVSTMKLLKTNGAVVLDIYVKPNSREYKVQVEHDELVVYCRESPIKGRVNRELVKELSRLFGRKVEIASGFTSKQKRVLIEDISLDEVNDIISELKQE